MSASDLYPFLAVRDTHAASHFYAEAFGATVVERFGPVLVLEIGGRHLGLAPEAPELGTPSAETLGATTVRISLHVDDPDGVAAQGSLPARRCSSPSRTRSTGCGRAASSTRSATTG